MSPGRPDIRERLLRDGCTTLGDAELVAVILGTGTRSLPVLEMANQILPLLDTLPSGKTAPELLARRGLGKAKTAKILAAFELVRRRIRPSGSTIRSPHDIIPLVSHLTTRSQEHFVVLTLNGAHEVIESRVVTIGLVNSCPVHPREVFADAVTDRATAIVVAHNHPSGDLTPSAQDIEITKRLSEAGTLLGIAVIDHVIFSQRGFYSFAEHGILPRGGRNPG